MNRKRILVVWFIVALLFLIIDWMTHKPYKDELKWVHEERLRQNF